MIDPTKLYMRIYAVVMTALFVGAVIGVPVIIILIIIKLCK